MGDYAAAGLPVINTLGISEYREALAEFGAGINCIPEDVMSVADALRILASDKDLRKQMRASNKRFAEDRFDTSCTYPVFLLSGLFP